MHNEKHSRVTVRILVKAFPQHSDKYEETVCCAGVREDTGALIRLFPITYRRLPTEYQFDRYDLIEVTLTKAGDPRPESYRLDQATLQVLNRGKSLSDASKVRLWSPFIAPSLADLQAQNRSESKRSLGIVRPDPGSLQFFHRAINAEEAEDARPLQAMLFDEPLKTMAPPEFTFGYRFTSASNNHEYSIQDWEVQAAYLAYQRQYGNKERALAMLDHEYGMNIPKHNPHFVMGTMKRRPHQFLLIGILRSPLDPQELAKQPSLFDQ
jgi:hypothetical protein